MKLQNYHQCKDIIEIDLIRHDVAHYNLKKCGEISTNGFYAKVNNDEVGIGVSKGKIYIYVNSKIYPEDEIISLLKSVESNRKFSLHSNDKQIYHVEYIPKTPHINYFSMEDEDVDLLLLIHNILNSNARKTIFIENNS